MSIARARRLVVATSAAALALAAAGSADEVVLKTGGRISGVIVERTAARVVIETGPGRVTLPMTRVERIVAAPSALSGYRERAATVAPTDARGWADLARWAEDRELTTQARDAWLRVVELEPGHPQANAALGRVQVDGRRLASDDAYRAQGFVPYEGRWVTPAEHEALLRERAAEEAERRERNAAQARAREAEARAAEAEARAREAEAAAQQPSDDGIPYWWWGYGGGGTVLPPIVDRPDHPRVEAPPASRPPVTQPPPRTIDGGGSGRPAKPSGGLGPATAPKPNPKQ
jgi:hypothetical protein